MRNGWYDVRVRENSRKKGTIEKDVVLLYRDGEFYQDYNRNARFHPKYKGEILKVYSDEPKMVLTEKIECDSNCLKNFVAAIYVQEINDYRDALVYLHYHPSNSKAQATIAWCEHFLDGLTVRHWNAIEVTRERAKYIIYRKDHGCEKCKFEGCPHRSSEDHPNGNFVQFRKVGCLKNENRNT